MSYDINELKQALNLAEDEIAEHLHTIDHLRDKVERLEFENTDWEDVARCARERAENAEANCDEYADQLSDEIGISKRFEALAESNARYAEKLEVEFQAERSECAAAARESDEDFYALANHLENAETRAEKAEGLVETQRAVIGQLHDRVAQLERSESEGIERADYAEIRAERAEYLVKIFEEERDKAESHRDMYYDDCNMLAESLRLMEERAETAEGELQQWADINRDAAENYYALAGQLENAEIRAEKAEAELSIWRDHVSNEETELSELKKALRTLGGDR